MLMLCHIYTYLHCCIHLLGLVSQKLVSNIFVVYTVEIPLSNPPLRERQTLAFKKIHGIIRKKRSPFVPGL